MTLANATLSKARDCDLGVLCILSMEFNRDIEVLQQSSKQLMIDNFDRVWVILIGNNSKTSSNLGTSML